MNDMNETQEVNLFLLELTIKQRAILTQLQSVEAAKIIECSKPSSDSTEDTRQIRQLCHLHGGFEQLTYILDYDRKVMEEAEEQKHQAMDLHPNDAPQFGGDTPTQKIQSLDISDFNPSF